MTYYETMMKEAEEAIAEAILAADPQKRSELYDKAKAVRAAAYEIRVGDGSIEIRSGRK